MNKEGKELINKISLDNATYNIDAIDCPNRIILRKDIDNILNIVERLSQENTNLKQALNKIRKLCVSNMVAWDSEGDCGAECWVDGFKVLQIIDK